MNQEQMDLLTFALGFLQGKLVYNQLSLSRFEQYLVEESNELQPIDGIKHYEEIPAVTKLLSSFVINIAPLMYEANWNKARAQNLAEKLGRLVAEGKISPVTIGVLTNTPSEDFEEYCRKYKEGLTE